LSDLLRTALYDEHLAAGGKLVNFGGWELPQQYTSIREEHLAVRQKAGLFDLSHMGRLDLRGPGAAEFLQGLLTNDVTRVAAGAAQYTLLCRDDGGIIDDLVIYRRGEDDFIVVVNASNREKDVAWMRAHLPEGVELTDRTFDVSLLALQGPLAQSVLPATGIDMAEIPYFGFRDGEIDGAPVILSRTGYTGEDGFEVFVDSEEAPAVWRAILAAGAEVGAVPAGLGARDACRMEAALRLYGNDMDEGTNPYDAGLGWVVRLAKGEFVGSTALQAIKAAGPTRELIGLNGIDRTIPRHDAAVSAGGRVVGKVTSGTFSFFLNRGIGLASVEKGSVVPGTRAEVDVRGQAGAVEVSALPLYRGSVHSPAKA